MKYEAIVAMTPNNTIGLKCGEIPWRQSNDLKRFALITKGNIVVMGRKTADTLDKPLPDRVNLVLTKHGYNRKGFVPVFNVQGIEKIASRFKNKKVFIIGGGQIYDYFLPDVNRIHATIVFNHNEYEEAVKFPRLNPDIWQVESRQSYRRDPNNQYVAYNRTRATPRRR